MLSYRVLLALFLCALVQPAGAALLEVDLNAPGDGLLTHDTDTDRFWLDPSETVGNSWDDIHAGAGGWIGSGWRYATSSEYCDVAEKLLIQPCLDGVFDPNTELWSGLLGTTYSFFIPPDTLAVGAAVTYDDGDDDSSISVANIITNLGSVTAVQVSSTETNWLVADGLGHLLVRTHCSDGLDNDGDTLVDLADPGCEDAQDDSEGAPRLTFFLLGGIGQPALPDFTAGGTFTFVLGMNNLSSGLTELEMVFDILDPGDRIVSLETFILPGVGGVSSFPTFDRDCEFDLSRCTWSGSSSTRVIDEGSVAVGIFDLELAPGPEPVTFRLDDFATFAVPNRIGFHPQSPEWALGAFCQQNAVPDFPAVTASKDWALQNDVDGDGLVDPGDTIRYTIVLQNDDPLPWSGAMFRDVPDPQAPLVPGSVFATVGTILSGNGAGDTEILIDLGSIAGFGSSLIQFDAVIADPYVPVAQSDVVVNQGDVCHGAADFNTQAEQVTFQPSVVTKFGVTITPIDLPECNDGDDNDGDGLVDYPADPGCASAASTLEAPQCSDGLDNDSDGDVDLADADCTGPADNREAFGNRCGLGAELVVLLPLLALARRRAGRP